MILISLGQAQEATSLSGGAATRIELDNGISFSINEASLPISIGRDASCDIHISSGHVSRKHCELYVRDGRLFLRDTSSNGTTVDDRLIKQKSVTIDRRTRVLLADEIKMVVTPHEGASAADPDASDRGEARDSRPPEQRASAPGMHGAADASVKSSERRRGPDRRQRNVVVPFDRRSGATERRSDG